MTTLIKQHYGVAKDETDNLHYIVSTDGAKVISQGFCTEDEAISWINYAIANDIDDCHLADVIQDFYTL